MNRLIKTYKNDKGYYHRENGPAITHYTKDGKIHSVVYYINGKIHNPFGTHIPAKINFSKNTIFSKEWYLNGERHREDGPAIEYSNGYKSWFLDSKCYSEQEYNEEMLNIRLRRLMEL